MSFELDSRLRDSTIPVTTLGLCQLRLVNDSRWPWLLLIPQRSAMSEIHDLASTDVEKLFGEAAQISRMLKSLTGCDKVNIAAIGNIVPQLHVHVVARYVDDANWPGPVWGFGAAMPYAQGEADAVVARLNEIITEAGH